MVRAGLARVDRNKAQQQAQQAVKVCGGELTARERRNHLSPFPSSTVAEFIASSYEYQFADTRKTGNITNVGAITKHP